MRIIRDEYLDQLEEYVKVLAPAAETERYFV
jgi:hypothetical protein